MESSRQTSSNRWEWMAAKAAMPEDYADRVSAFARLWRRTPYHNGQRQPGAGVGCEHLIAAYLDAVFLPEEPTILPASAIDSGMDSELRADELIGLLYDKFGGGRATQGTIRFGDILVRRSGRGAGFRGGAAHGMIAMASPFLVYHASAEIGRVIQETLSDYSDVVFRFRPEYPSCSTC